MTALPHEPFSDREQHRSAAMLGMWLFLGTEVLLFGGLLTGYLVYRLQYPAAWQAGSGELYTWIGAVNTVILLTSSYFAALAVRAATLMRRRSLLLFVALTVLMGVAFLGLKGVEYYLDITRGHLLPGFNLAGDPDVSLFLTFYWILTGLHAVHMTVGLGVWCVIALQTFRRLLPSASTDLVEVAGMYWHFVDVVWLFLLPLLYLVKSP